MSEYWNQQLQPWNQGAGNLSRAMIRIPYMRAQAANRAAMVQIAQAREQSLAQEQQSREGLISSQKGLADANTQTVLKKLALSEALAQKTAPALRALQSGDLQNPAIDDYVNTASAATDENKGDIVKAFRGLLSTTLAAGGNVPKAAAVENPVSVANNQVNADERASRPIVAGNGSTVINPKTGAPLATAATTLNPGQARFGATTNLTDSLTPVASGIPLPAKSTAVDNAKAQMVKDIILKQGDTGNGTTNTIASATGQLSQAMQPPAAAPAGASAMIRVQHPTQIDPNTGQPVTGSIPAANLDAALKAGFKQIGQ